MTQRHPDPDDLADLAADVLDPAADAALRSHVSDCDECAGLLDEATRIRSLLLADDPGPMPDDVWARIELALANEVAGVRAGVASSSLPGSSQEQPPGSRPGPQTDLSRFAAVEADGPAHAAALDEDDRPTAKLRRPVRSTQSTRRQRKEDHGSRWSNARSSIGWGGLAAVAAGVLLVVGLGGTMIHGLLPDGASINPAGMLAQDEDSGTSGTAGAQAFDARTPGSVVVSTDTNYQPSKLTGQVRALVEKVHGAPSVTFSDDSSTRTEATSGLTALGGDLPAGAWSSTELARCLKAIDAEDLSPIAVDFARFNGRDVALLVLPSPGKEYEVWAVSRSCRPGADGTQFFQIVKP